MMEGFSIEVRQFRLCTDTVLERESFLMTSSTYRLSAVKSSLSPFSTSRLGTVAF